MTKLKTLLTILIGVFAGLAVTVTDGGNLITTKYIGVLSVSLVLLTVLSIALRKVLGEDVLGYSRQPRPSNLPSGTSLEFVAPDLSGVAEKALTTFARRFPDAGIIDNLRDALLDISSRTIRISENVTFDRNSVKFRTSRTILHYTNGLEITPVYRLAKKALLDDFLVRVDDEPAQTLSHVECQGALLMVLTILFKDLFQLNDKDLFSKTFNDDPKNEGHSSCYRTLVAAVVDPAPRGDNGALQVGIRLRTLAGVHQVDMTGARFRALLQLAEQAVNFSLIFALVGPSESRRSKVTIEHRVRSGTSSGAQGTRLKIWRDNLRLAIGLESRTYFLTLPAAVETPSYHLTTDAPDGMYSFNTLLRPVVIKRQDERAPALAGSGDSPVATLSDLVGVNYVHVYSRDLNGNLGHLVKNDLQASTNSEVILGLELEFRETPPGVMLQVGMSSLFVAGVAIIAGRFYDSVFSNAAGGAGARLIFGVPAILAGWVVARWTPEVAGRVSLPTAFMAAWLVVNSLAVTLFAGLHGDVHQPKNALYLHFLRINHAPWAILVFSTAFHLAISIFMLWARTGRYRRRFRQGHKALANQGRMTA